MTRHGWLPQPGMKKGQGGANLLSAAGARKAVVPMVRTGVCWRPVWNILEPSGKLDLILLNPQPVKAVPGHKTDRVDAARIAELAQYDLVRASFVPPPEIRERRDLVRRRVHLQQDRNRISNRIHRLLELQNVKLSSVPGKMTGATARSILEGLASKKMTIKPEKPALLRRPRFSRGHHVCWRARSW